MENNSQLFDSPKKSNRNDAQSPTKLQQNQSEFDNQGSPDKEKKTEKTKAEAVILIFF